MGKYRLQENGGVYDTELDISIPPNISNTYWNNYVTWLSEGNIPDPIMHTVEENPSVYAIIYFTDGDGKVPPGINLDGSAIEQHLTINGDIRMYEDISQSVITQFTNDYRVTVRKVVSEQEDNPVDSYSIVIGFESGVITKVNDDISRYYSNNYPGVYCISEDDFIPVDFYGITYTVKLINNPVYFKVYP